MTTSPAPALSRRTNILLFALFAALVLIMILLSWNRYFDHDEFEHVHSAWKMLHGERIYTDFFQHHHPLFYVLLMPGLSLLKDSAATILALRLGMLLFAGGVFFLTYRIAVSVFKNARTGILSLVFLGSMVLFVTKIIELRPDVPQTLFGLLAILFAVEYLSGGAPRKLAYAGISLGLSFLFLQKAVFLLIPAVIFFLYMCLARRMPWKHFGIFSAGFAAPLVPFYLYFILAGSFGAYIYFNWILNMNMLRHFPPWYAFKGSFIHNAGFWVFWLAGLFFAFKLEHPRLIAVLSVLMLGSVFLARTPYPQYFLMALPLMAIVAAHGFQSLLKDRPAFAALALTMSLVYPATLLAFNAVGNSNAGQMRKIDYVVAVTRPGDLVYDGNIDFNVFRRDVDFFWYSLTPGCDGLATHQSLAVYPFDIRDLILKKQPEVISGYGLDPGADESLSRRYAPSDTYRGLFLRIDEGHIH